MSNINYKNKENPQTLGDFLFFGKSELSKLENPPLETEILLSFVLEKDRVWLKTNTEKKLSKEDATKFRDILEKRKNHTPMAYILGYKMWHDLKIEVSPDVLIPRDETEILADYIVENPQKKRSNLNFSRDFTVKRILDIGTGSGCLAIFMGKNFPEAEVIATDISVKALNIAKKNAKNHQVEIEFIESDLLEKIQVYSPPDKGELEGVSEIPRNFDIIIANLPYVPTNIKITEEVKKEPHNAIFSGEDGLDLIRKLAEQLESREISFQELWLEFWTAQELEISNIFAEYKVEFYPDLSGDTYFARILPKKDGVRPHSL